MTKRGQIPVSPRYTSLPTAIYWIYYPLIGDLVLKW